MKTRLEMPDFMYELYGHFCGCGAPELAYQEVINELRRLADRGKPPEGHDENGLWWLLVYFLDSLDLTEHGISVRGAWLTDKGGDVLKFLEEHGADWTDDEEIDWLIPQS